MVPQMDVDSMDKFKALVLDYGWDVAMKARLDWHRFERLKEFHESLGWRTIFRQGAHRD